MSDRPERKSLARSLGEFVGHIWGGLRAEVPAPGVRAEVRREVEERRAETESGELVLRRTTIEEVEIRPAQGAARPSSGGSSR